MIKKLTYTNKFYNIVNWFQLFLCVILTSIVFPFILISFLSILSFLILSLGFLFCIVKEKVRLISELFLFILGILIHSCKGLSFYLIFIISPLFILRFSQDHTTRIILSKVIAYIIFLIDLGQI